ncbi:S-layer protein domain-containing protein [Methanosarcina sp.]|jgi:S-layer protein (TIGR01567 family)|uniref:S-layer protein domain-containing protein n=1 Tax=Methanosarcina sp. TaxID=2213 RepID=UPI002C179299|nr:S-layer protein domain-containing protein [Methanosarcina sp.]HOW14485.1 S-layer protein domain-containing protein [Methanosarcina sp.]
MKKAILQIFTAILVLGLFCGAAGAAPSVIGVISPDQNSTVTGTVGATQTFTIPLNETANVIWTENGVPTTISTDGSNIATLNHVFQSGSYQVTASIDGVGQIAAWNVQGTEGALSITSKSPENNPSTGTNATQEFSVGTNKAADITWYINGIAVDSVSGVTSDTYQNVSSTAGTYNVTVVALNGTETASYKWDWTVGSSTNEVPVEVNPSDEKVSISQGGNKTFYVNSTNNQNIKVEWLVNSESKGSQEGTSSSYNFNADTSGSYNLSAVITDPSGKYDSLTKTWNVTVNSKYFSSGNRIWDEDLGMDTTYTWNAQSFSGFYYDLDSGVSSEEMTIKDIGRNIDGGNIEYSTRPTETDFEYNSWGSYQIIGFMAEKYFAGYSEENSTVIGDDISLISDGVLTKILIDSDDKESAYSGDSFELEDGYSLNIVEVDVNGKSVWVQLEKDGDVVDDGFISSGEDYIYKTEIGEAEDVPIIIVHFGTVFAGTETSAVFIQGIFQVSDNYVEISNGDSYGEMEVKSISSSEIKMENEDDVGLDKGDIIDLMGKIQIQVADDDTLRFAPVLDTSEEGTYELRGTVYDEDVDGDTLPTWTPYNFEGFYYNIDEGIETEKMEITDLNDRNIPDGSLVYTSTPKAVEFEHDDWGNFTVVGFMAKKYFAGYPDDTADGQIDEVSLLSDNILSEVLTDTDDKESFYSGDALELEEGYSLNILEVDVNGESVWVQLEKDGDVVDDEFVTSGQDYIYEGTLGEAEDVPMIIVHFGTVFAGTETSAVFTEGIFQISDEYIEINNGDTFDEMEVTSVSESGITMKNEGDIGLGEDETIDVMGDIKFKTADSDTLRFYPFVEVESEGNSSKELNINLPSEIIVGDTFDIEVTAGNFSIEGATVKVNTTNVGKTNADGIVEYTAEKEGTFKITAEKDGYTTANKNMKVIPPKEKMSLNITPEKVYVGDTVTIEALKAVGGDPIEGANISIDGNAVGKTDSDGKFTYTTEEVGKIKISATAEGFLDKSVEVNVKDYEAIFEFSNLVVDPIEVRAGKEATITIDAENTGNAAGEYNVELIVNETSVGSQKISLGVGESTTVTFKHSEEVPGTYTVKVGGQETTYTVKEKSSMLLYTLIGIILLLVGGIAYMFTKGGWTAATVQAKIDELIKSVNLKK